MAEKRSFSPTPPQAKRSGRRRRVLARSAAARPLGEGAPAGLDIHDLGQADKPQQDWGEPADEGATFSANHTRRAVKTEADRGQGRKTRAAKKDEISRRV